MLSLQYTAFTAYTAFTIFPAYTLRHSGIYTPTYIDDNKSKLRFLPADIGSFYPSISLTINNNNESFSSICRGVDVWFVLLDKPKLNSEQEESGWSGVQRCPGIVFRIIGVEKVA